MASNRDTTESLADKAEPFFALSVFDDEPRVLDVEVAAKLRMAKPTNIRQVIQANIEEIQRFGNLHAARANSGQRGRPGDEFWLNEEQALCVATLSRAPRSSDVRFMLIKTFVAFRRGQLTASVDLNDPKILRGLIEIRVGGI